VRFRGGAVVFGGVCNVVGCRWHQWVLSWRPPARARSKHLWQVLAAFVVFGSGFLCSLTLYEVFLRSTKVVVGVEGKFWLFPARSGRCRQVSDELVEKTIPVWFWLLVLPYPR